MINAILTDTEGKSPKYGIDGEVPVVIHAHPPLNDSILQLPISQFFVNSAGSSDMIVNGATTNQDFYIDSNSEYDIYITSITIQISDVGAQLDDFGALPALTNGLQWIYKNPTIGDYTLSESIKTNLDFLRDATGGKGFGNGVDAFRADISGGGGIDTYFPEIDLHERFGLPYGLRIPKQTNGRLIYRVRDNLAGLNIFNIKAYGFRLQVVGN